MRQTLRETNKPTHTVSPGVKFWHLADISETKFIILLDNRTGGFREAGNKGRGGGEGRGETDSRYG